VRRFCILCANALLQKTVGSGTLVLEFYAFLQKREGACVREQAQTITDEERRMILETIPKHYAGTMVLTMLCCGLRPIEIRRMKWDWIDFENAILTVGKSKTEAGTGRKINSAILHHLMFLY